MLCVSHLIILPSTTSGAPDTCFGAEEGNTLTHSQVYTLALKEHLHYIKKAFISQFLHQPISFLDVCTYVRALLRLLPHFTGCLKCEMSFKKLHGCVEDSWACVSFHACHPTSQCYVAPQTEIASVTCVLVPEILSCCL